MQKFIYNMERKFGRYAIRNLINYFMILYVAATVLNVFNPYFYPYYLSLDFGEIAHGQIWRLFSFILAPSSLKGFVNILFFVITVNLYYLFGHSLENAWGSFRFDLYFIGGIILTVLAELILYLFTGQAAFYGGMSYVYQSMFFAFCTLFPDEQFLLYFVFPIKAKYLAALDGVLLLVQCIQYFAGGDFASSIAILVAMGNFLLFFWLYKGMGRGVFFSREQNKRRRAFHAQTRMRPQSGITKHKCAICGRTEISNPELSFRFCSKCAGNYEYCEDHLFTHQHVTNQNTTNQNTTNQ